MKVEYREEPCRAALNLVKGMPFRWSLNPYMGCAHRCTFCYVRAFERRADRPSGEAYGTSIRVKTNVADVLRRELARRTWAGEMIAVGAATDPYQPAEARFGLTRACLRVLAAARNPFSLITRGPLIVRDADLLAEASRLADVSVTFSIPTLDREIWRRTEIATAPPRQRLRALRTLVDAGVRAGVGMAPILPGLTDDPTGMADVVREARDAGACFVWANLLYLQPGTREHFLDHLARDWPELLPMYQRLYAGRAYLGDRERTPVLQRVAELRDLHGLTDRREPRVPPTWPRVPQSAGPQVPPTGPRVPMSVGPRVPMSVGPQVPPSAGPQVPPTAPQVPPTAGRHQRALPIAAGSADAEPLSAAAEQLAFALGPALAPGRRRMGDPVVPPPLQSHSRVRLSTTWNAERK